MSRLGSSGDGGGRPVFIVGAGRSGNTLIRSVLLASNQIYIPPETYEVGRIIEIWPRTALLRWDERVMLFCAIFEKNEHFEDFGVPNLDDFASAASALPRRERSLRRLFDEFYLHMARVAGSDCARWGDKTPWNAFALRPIRRVFRDAQFIWVVRNGLDVTLSYVQAGLYPDARSAAERWVAANAACAELARRVSGDALRVEYEATVSQPEEAFRRIFDWAGLDFAAEFLGGYKGRLHDVEFHPHHARVLQPINTSSVGRWRTRLSAEAIGQLPESFWRTMDELGYGEEAREALQRLA